MSLGYGSSWSGDNNKQCKVFVLRDLPFYFGEIINKSYISGGKGH